ncbi:dihydroneopterin aldolase [Prochlorococcus marinus]|uniref:Possible dihydroneopterin aldolase n=1 Tax=Prochlorococcus marinus (strain MIT 9211) TaxID=93059 RepID=A9BAX8_PROM4|nr:dihydroneopterin aldolase [Prochlorococcus marinus]ABX08990.1 Possible dihydroneopterin aldolase [Prochlorococcus marinus str. MIT 9211]
MKEQLPLGVIDVEGLNLWSHVGVLERERLMGQYFILDFSVCVDVSSTVAKDDLTSTVDYSLAIKGLQQLSLACKSQTIESFSENILDFLEDLYGLVPIKIKLKKCHPPISGFSGSVSISRTRNFSSN